MATIGQVINQLLPQGSLGDGGGIESCPDWPPDLFAVAATLAERAGIYAEPAYTAGWDSTVFHFNDGYRTEVSDAAAIWAKDSKNPPSKVEALWAELLSLKETRLEDERPSSTKWKSVLMQLISIADETCHGIGFLPSPEDPDSYIPGWFVKDHVEKLKSETYAGSPPPKLSMPYIPMSLCRNVSPADVCVQPKTMTPNVGCNLRSLTHHLALLPPRGMVATSWYCAYPEVEDVDQSFNVLLVPFPYVIHGKNFRRVDTFHGKDRFFSLAVDWLGGASSDDFASFLEDLIREAEKDVGQVHAVVLPECALPEEVARLVSEKIADKIRHLELFVSGTLSQPKAQTGLPKNAAYTSRFHEGIRLKDWSQSKHHRWRLEKDQVKRYQLGHTLDPELKWWEQIDIANRTCVFTVVRPGASLAVLVCEDLARFDPVLPAINAVGPNLVIALLMDGPQLEYRWPGRYATVLADDPGSSVLTLTSQGMIRRSTRPGGSTMNQVALWKEPGGKAQELSLGVKDHALVLALTVSRQEQFTLDGRSDGMQARQFNLSAVRGVKASNRPPWLTLD